MDLKIGKHCCEEFANYDDVIEFDLGEWCVNGCAYDGPVLSGMKYCPFCGKELGVASQDESNGTVDAEKKE